MPPAENYPNLDPHLLCDRHMISTMGLLPKAGRQDLVLNSNTRNVVVKLGRGAFEWDYPSMSMNYSRSRPKGQPDLDLLGRRRDSCNLRSIVLDSSKL